MYWTIGQLNLTLREWALLEEGILPSSASAEWPPRAGRGHRYYSGARWEDAAILMATVRLAVDQLEPKYSEPIRLLLLARRTAQAPNIRTVAKVLGISTSEVYRRVQEGKERLLAILEG